jgi:exodeoxyribonuclease V gamma subunit
MMPPLERLSVTPHGDHWSLLEGVLGSIGKNRHGLEPVQLVVPSVHIRDWLQIHIARRLGICMGIRFSMPGDFVSGLFRAAGIVRAAGWAKRNLEWAVFGKVCSEPGLLPLLPPGAPIRDAFAAARAVADRFDQYAHFRPAMLEAWAAGGFFFGNGNPDEHWQRRLWLSLYESFGNDPGPVPSRLGGPDALGKLRAAVPHATVIGSGSLDPLLVESLRRLAAAGTRVEVHLALPCLGYLGDLCRRRASGKTTEPGLGGPENSLPADWMPQNPLLASMGRHAAGTFALAAKLDEQYSNWDELPPVDGPQSLLGRIQAGIRENMPYADTRCTAGPDLSVHECYGPLRELEVLRNELLRAFAEVGGLRPDEVLIAAPSLDEYAPVADAVFQSGGNPLPVRIAELPPGAGGDAALEGLIAVLGIARGGRGRASEVLDLLQLRAVRSSLGVEEGGAAAEFLAGMLRSSGLAQGLRGGGSEAPGGWGFSLDRLAAGAFFGPGEPNPGCGDFHLPVADVTGSDFQAANRFLDWLFDLRETLCKWQEPASAAEWARRLLGAARDLLCGGEDDLAEASKCSSFLEGIPCNQELDAGLVLDWLEAESAESNRRTPPSGAILFGRLRQLHNTPCRVLALVGMQNEAFPSRTTPPSWDLLRAKPEIWDRNARVDDRQMFLDSVLAPSERLIITASTRNIRTNKSQPLSTCVEELLSAATSLGANRGDLVREHPLQPFSAKYFSGGGNLGPQFCSAIRRIAVAANSDTKTPQPFHRPAAAGTAAVPAETTAAQLADFWRNPARGYLRAQKIALPMDREDDSTLDFAPMDLDGLQRWKLRDAILGAQLAGTACETRLKLLAAADRGLPPGFLAAGEWRAFQKMQGIADAIKSRNPARETLEALVSGCRISCPALVADGTVLAGDCGKMKEPRHWLPHWLAALVAAASGLKGGLTLFSEGDPWKQTDLPAIARAEAEETLAVLLDGWLQGQQRPLRFAPQTSHALLSGNFPDARKAWSLPAFGAVQAPEGKSPAALLAWRDSDPFLDGAEWLGWAGAVSRPLENWKSERGK